MPLKGSSPNAASPAVPPLPLPHPVIRFGYGTTRKAAALAPVEAFALRVTPRAPRQGNSATGKFHLNKL
ncbi:MAG TPA: hypothetical protein VEZ40_00035 [Pyrinomonadaceae bacterium]|nr:hypothetical protein [Pyrinomonadaceae bacterium]